LLWAARTAIGAAMQKSTVWDSIPRRLRALGIKCWLWLGIASCIAIVAALLNSISGLVIPFVIALVVAMLFHPVVDALERWRIPRVVGSLAVLFLMLAVLVSCFWVSAVGIFNQYGEIASQAKLGVAALSRAADQMNLSGELVDSLSHQIMSGLPRVASGAASVFTSGLSGGFAFFIGSFAAVLLLFYLLADWHNIMSWVSAHMGLPDSLGKTLLHDATAAVREYFIALTLSSIVVSVTIGTTIGMLGLPLALTVGLFTMVTSYIPYIGAILAGVFAFLVALGSGDLSKAFIVLVVILVVQNVVQTVIQNKLASDRLKLHPIVTFTTVIGGGILFGVLGATLANPVAAVIAIFHRRYTEYERDNGDPDGPHGALKQVETPNS